MNAPRSRPLLALVLLLAGCPPDGGQTPVLPGEPAAVDSPAADGEQGGVTTGLFTPTAELLGPEPGWGAARLRVREDRGMAGYAQVWLQGDGTGLRRQVEQHQTERRERLRLPPERVRALLRRFVAADARRFEPIPGRPDASYAELFLSGPGGEWRVNFPMGGSPAGVPPALPELLAACQATLGEAEAVEEYAGPYQEGWELPGAPR